MFDNNIDNNELDRVLTLCNGFKLATICLSLDYHITQTNIVAEELFFRTKSDLLDRSFQDICREFGFEFFLKHSPINLQPHYTVHWISDLKFVDVCWHISQCMTEGECTGYLLVGKIVNTATSNHPIQHMEKMLQSMPVGLYSKALDGSYSFVNEYESTIAGFASPKAMLGIKDENAPWQNEIEFIRYSDERVRAENQTIIFNEQMTLHKNKHQILMTKTPLKDDHNHIIGIIGTCIVTSIHSIHNLSFTEKKGSHFISPEHTKTHLTKREIDCVLLLIKGKSSSEIATVLNISSRTVEFYLNNIKKKLNCYKLFQVGYLVGKYGHLLL